MGPGLRRDDQDCSRGAIHPSFTISLSLCEQRAQGMPGARCTRGLVCQELRIWRTRAYRAAETLRHPLRNGFTAYTCSPRWSGLVVTVTPEKLASQELGASIAAPGPHDFAVRSRTFAFRPPRPSHPAPNVS